VAAITPRLELHRQRLSGLEASLTYLDQADSLEQVASLAAELEALLGERQRGSQGGGRQARHGPGSEGVPQPLELHTAAGLPLQVGRNHRQNEWIAFRQARRGDLWFHAQEIPGSHVVLKSSQQEPSEGDLQAAADLAAHFSRGRGNRRVPVVMVPTEELQRIPGAAPGTVRHRGGTVLWGEPQRALSLLPEPTP
jgi:predicted ribosome quality control (RQC) complex YloA/Tae2 family protein